MDVAVPRINDPWRPRRITRCQPAEHHRPGRPPRAGQACGSHPPPQRPACDPGPARAGWEAKAIRDQGRDGRPPHWCGRRFHQRGAEAAEAPLAEVDSEHARDEGKGIGEGMSENGASAIVMNQQPSAGVIEMPRRQLVLVTVGVMLALLLAALDQTIVGTAMPRIIAELNGFDRYAWVTTAYLLTSTITVPIAGKLGDLFGRKPFIIAGMAGFMAMSWLCGFSQNMTELILFRGAQGLFGGVLFASVFTVLADIFTPQTRARMQGVFGGVFGLASIIGPTAGGFITDNWGWRWVFYVNIPVGVLGIALLAMFLPFVRTHASWRNIDFLGAGLLALALTPILIALSETTTYGWGSWQTLVPLIGGILVLIVFIFVEAREDAPIVPIAVGFISSFGMFGTIIFIPLVYQGVLGISATNSGALITPLMFGLIGASIVTGQLMTRIKQYQYLGTLGAAITAVGMYLLSEVTVHSTQLEVTASLVFVGIGLGVTMPLYIQAVQSAVDRKFP